MIGSALMRYVLVGCVALSPAVHAAEVTVAVAANFAAPLKAIADLYARDTGHHAQISVGSTGRFYAQISHGAPFDVLLAADEATPHKLEREGQAVPGTRFTYATGQLALWSRQAGQVDGQGKVLQLAPTRLAIADPKLAPYGAAAIQTLTHMGVLDSWRPRLVQGESIAQAYQFVATGNAPLGFVALSQVYAHGKISSGSGWIVPSQWHAPLRQDAVLLVHGKDNPAASALLAYLKGEQARAVLRAYGYSVEATTP